MMLIAGIIEAMEDILSQVEAQSPVETSVRKCRISLLWCSQSYWWCRRRIGVSELKIRPLEKIRIGGVGTLTALTACNNEILRNIAPFGQDLCQIWCHQCIVMTDFVDRFYKKTPTPAMITLFSFLSFTITSMLADREVQELLRDFELMGLQNLMSTPPTSAPHEETPPVPTQQMQT